ncbi:serine/threonine-protein kinase [Streptomyces sp. NPDC002812]|uniref:serine/threonine-protein kinase n=1 Tax=Streptomyces sp. NPDC002812 TaxID=3154434 RepID=UPI00332023D2
MSSSGSAGRVRPPRPGDPGRIGPYRVIGRLGEGGMGTVHAALTPDGVKVAVKVIHPAQAEDPEFRARFRREVALSSRVQGPCLLPLLAADPEAAAPWLASEFAPGPTLSEHLAALGPLTGGSRHAFATGTAQALAAIHRAGVVHRDVKPQNVILSPSGPRVLDFGIAHAVDGTSVTRTGVMTGTPGWISPEQYRTGTAGPAGDVFAWGALVAYASTGRLPFGTGAPDVVAFRVMAGEAELTGVPEGLREIVARALSKEPGERPTAAEAADACATLLSAQATQVLAPGGAPTLVGDLIAAEWHMPAPDDPSWYAPAAASRTRTLAVVALAAALVGGLGGGIAAFVTNEDGGGPRGATRAASATATAAAATAVHPAPGSSASPAGNATRQGGPAKETGTGTGSGEASIATWRESRPGRTAAETDTYGAMGTGAWLDPVAYPHAENGTLTFHQERKEVYVAMGGSGGGLPPVAVQEIAQLACLGLRDLVRIYPDYPYTDYVIVDTARAGGPGIVWEDDFRTNPTCTTSVTQRTDDWRPGQPGLARAQVPSSDREEIRVATDAVAGIFARWPDGSLGHHNTSAGYDPEGRALYVWVKRPDWDGATRASWARIAASAVCRSLRAQAAGSANWPYTRWAAVITAEDGTAREFMSSGTLADCPA